MHTVLVVSKKSEIEQKLSRLLSPGYSVFSASDPSLIDSYSKSADILIIDLLSWKNECSVPQDSGAIILSWSDIQDDGQNPGYFDNLSPQDSDPRIIKIIDRALEYHKARIAAVSAGTDHAALHPGYTHQDMGNPERLTNQDIYLNSFRQKEALKAFSKIFSAATDSQHLVELFIIALKDLVSVSRVAVFMKKKAVFSLCASYGYGDETSAAFHFTDKNRLVQFLQNEAIIFRKNAYNSTSQPHWVRDALADMDTLKAAIAVPVLTKGRLTGFIALNNKITGEPFFREELDLLFSLTSQLALWLESSMLSSELSQSRTYIEQILANIASGVISIDETCIITTCNEKAAFILGMEQDAVIGKHVSVLPEALAQVFMETISERKVYTRKEIRIDAPDLPLGVSTALLYGQKQEPAGSVVIFSDISDVLRQEARKREAARTEFLNKVAMRSSHELKNCLVSIKTFTQLLPEKYVDEDFRCDFYSVMNKEVDRLNFLVENLLFFSNSLQLKIEPLPLEQVINDCLESLDLRSDKTIRTSVSLHEPRLLLNADREKIIKALSSVIRNAVQAATHGGEITITSSETTLPAGRSSHPAVRIIIEDTGCGIEQSERDSVFEPFYTTKTRGMGLGLTIAKKIIEEHDGTIHIESHPETGTAVELCIPIHDKPAEIKKKTSAKKEAELIDNSKIQKGNFKG